MPCGGSGSGVAEGAGVETDARLTGVAAFGLAVAIDAVRVGAASPTDGLVLSQWWTRTPAASVARSVTGTMSVDFMVSARLPSILPKES